ncbi:MAG TPA: ABC-type transport auxiliary lipoprotein family protein, partial [Thermoanaerobaculia bacterium]|nr:ABC-type transport auxiliary lipoprotein family protein [Thermoanaerobaculia bacterium]
SAIAFVSAMAALVLGACGGLLKRPEIRHYALPPSPAIATAPAPIAAGELPIGIGTVELPPGLDRPDIVVRTSAERFDVRGHELWPAPLGTVVRHRLAFDLAARLPEGLVILPGQVQPAGGTRALDLSFAELAAGPAPVLVLDVRWTLRPSVQPAAVLQVGEPRSGESPANVGVAVAVPVAASPALAGHEHIDEPLDSLDSASIAAGTSRALAKLADRLVAAIGAGAPVG